MGVRDCSMEQTKAALPIAPKVIGWTNAQLCPDFFPPLGGLTPSMHDGVEVVPHGLWGLLRVPRPGQEKKNIVKGRETCM